MIYIYLYWLNECMKEKMKELFFIGGFSSKYLKQCLCNDYFFYKQEEYLGDLWPEITLYISGKYVITFKDFMYYQNQVDKYTWNWMRAFIILLIK